MLTCDICGKEIEDKETKKILPREYRSDPKTKDVCKSCDSKLTKSINDIKRNYMVARRQEIKTAVENLKVTNMSNNQRVS